MSSAALTRDDVLATLREIHDPEIGTSIVDLGLIYGVEIDQCGAVKIQMTTTSRFCPASGFIVEAVKVRVGDMDFVVQVIVDLVYDPPWDPEMAVVSMEPPLQAN